MKTFGDILYSSNVLELTAKGIDFKIGLKKKGSRGYCNMVMSWKEGSKTVSVILCELDKQNTHTLSLEWFEDLVISTVREHFQVNTSIVKKNYQFAA